jgi:hypothetical protein
VENLNKKDRGSLEDKSKDEKPIDSHRMNKYDKKKWIKKIIYYDTDSSTSSSTSSKDESTSKHC